jgi:hypothetical protein
MKLTVLKALLLPIAFLALGGINQASADTCNASYTMTAVEAGAFSCTIGDLTFSNFTTFYAGGGGATPPDPTSDVIVNFAEMSTGSDPFGTAASAGSPIYSVITDYTGDNSVGESQGLTGVVQYLVTDSSIVPGTSISQVDVAFTGLAANTAAGSLTKDICSAQFGGGIFPNGVCPGSEMTVTSGLGLGSPAGQVSDSSTSLNLPFSLSSMGVYDSWTLDGGTTDGTAVANVTAVENDFIEIGVIPPTPEPGTFVLFGGALIGLLVVRRRKLA